MGLMQRVLSDNTKPVTPAQALSGAPPRSLLRRADSVHLAAHAAIDSLLAKASESDFDTGIRNELYTHLQHSDYGSLSAFHVLNAVIHSLEIEIAAVLFLDTATNMYIPAATTGFDTTSTQRFQIPTELAGSYMQDSQTFIPRNRAMALRDYCSIGLWDSATDFIFTPVFIPSRGCAVRDYAQAVITTVCTRNQMESPSTLARLQEVFSPLAAAVLFNRQLLAKQAVPKPVIYHNKTDITSRNPALYFSYNIDHLVVELSDRVPFADHEALRQDIIDSTARILSRIAITAVTSGSTQIHIGIMQPGITESMLRAALLHGYAGLYPEMEATTAII